LVFTLRTSWRLVILRVQQSDEAANKWDDSNNYDTMMSKNHS
jgi:hypothetical protein